MIISSIRNIGVAMAILFVTSAVAQAQPDERIERKTQEIAAMKVGFLTKRLTLTPEEAQVFWPVYNKMQDERDKLRTAMKESRRELKEDFESRSDAEVEKAVDGEIAFRQQEIDLMKKYHSEFKRVLPIKKVARLYRSEEEFKRELLHRLQERKRDERTRNRIRR